MRSPVSRFRQCGFSLVELMVGVAIGLLGVLIIMQVSTVFEGQKRTTTTGSDAQTSGSLAFYSVERDVRRAGFGFSVPGIMGCTVKRYSDGKVLPDLILQPVEITKGTGNAPDAIRVLSSAKSNWSVPVRMIKAHAQSATEMSVNSTLGIRAGDLLIAYEPGKNCTMFQATGPVGSTGKAISDPVKVEHEAGTAQSEGLWNPEDPTEIFPPGGYGVDAQVFNLGGMIDRTYSLDGTNLQVSDDGGVTQRVIAADVMNLKAQYGTVNAAKTLVWGDTLALADIGRLVAVRLAIVARSPLKEKADAEGNCNATAAANAPKWAGQKEDESLVSGDDWQCYRYKTFENVIPLRNMMWKESDAS
ncbi:PilW family protein [Oxalicibacterium solurbis]|nr:PilW family protein [Oxalicibacterium solurbis]